MLRVAVFASALTVMPCIAAAQQPCTADARQVVEQAYRQVLERSADPASSASVDALSRGTTVREIVRGLARSSEHLQRFGNQARENAIVDVYRHLLNRGPDPEGLRNNVDLVNRRGIVPLIDQLVDSPEYRQKFGDWTVPGSNVRFCAPGERQGQQQSSNNAPGNGGNNMRFRRMDTNNDGQIQRNEWRGNPQSFSNFDWNNDGVLSGEEVSVAAAQRGNRGNRGEDFEVGNADRFDYLDINGNGFIERNEWDGGQNAFDQLDTSSDRRLSRAEFDNMSSRGSDFARVDMNGDGRIRLNEWPWSHTSFDRQDGNGDGAITQNEYRGAPAERR